MRWAISGAFNLVNRGIRCWFSAPSGRSLKGKWRCSTLADPYRGRLEAAHLSDPLFKSEGARMDKKRANSAYSLERAQRGQLVEDRLSHECKSMGVIRALGNVVKRSWSWKQCLFARERLSSLCHDDPPVCRLREVVCRRWDPLGLFKRRTPFSHPWP